MFLTTKAHFRMKKQICIFAQNLSKMSFFLLWTDQILEGNRNIKPVQTHTHHPVTVILPSKLSVQKRKLGQQL